MPIDPKDIRSNVPSVSGQSAGNLANTDLGYPPIPPGLIEASTSNVENAINTLVDTQTKVYDHAAGMVSTLDNAVRGVKDKAIGTAGIQVGKAEEIIGKVQGKIKKSAINKIGTIYDKFLAFGIGIPDMDAVRYGNMSGDFLGSMGISPDATKQPPTQTTQPTQPQITPGSLPQTNPGDSGVDNGNSGVDSGTIAPDTHPTMTPFTAPPTTQPGFPPGCQFTKSNWTTDPNDIWFSLAQMTVAKPLYVPDDKPPQGFHCWVRLLQAGNPSAGVDFSFRFYLPDGYTPDSYGDLLIWGVQESATHTALSKCFDSCHSSIGGPVDVPGPTDQPPGDECQMPAFCPDPNAAKCDAQPLKAECPKPIIPPIKVEKPGDDVCKYIEDLINRLTVPNVDLSSWLSANPGDKGTSTLATSIVRAILGSDDPLVPSITFRLSKWMEDTVNHFINGVDCNRASMAPIALWNALVGFIQKWLGVVPEQAVSQARIASNSLCQHKLPLGGMADVAYLRGDITKEEWECFHRAEGNHLDPARKIMNAGRAKPDPTQIDRLFRRKKITEAEYKDLMRQAGVLKDEDKQHIHDLNESWPSVSETITYMNRDVTDEKNIDWSEVDDDFKNNYTGRVKDYFDANGYTEERAKDAWRAHYHYPSFQMAAEMLQRNRPGAVDESAVVTREDMRKLLKTDDWHPSWIDALIEISYKRLTRVDVRRAYMIHAVDDKWLEEKILDLGYKPDDVPFWVAYYKKQREMSDRKAAGYPTPRELVAAYARCEITEEMFQDGLSKVTIDDDETKAAIEAAKFRRDLWERRNAIRTIRKPYVNGVYDRPEAIQQLQDAGVDAQCIESLLQQWDRDMARRPKQIPAQKLCEMRWYGIISLNQHVEMLVNLGYEADEASLMAADCTAYLSEKASKQAARVAEKQLAELRRRQREAAKAARLEQCGPPDCPKNTPGGKAGG